MFDSKKLDLINRYFSKSGLDYFFPRNVESSKNKFHLKLARAFFTDFAVITRIYQQT